MIVAAFAAVTVSPSALVAPGPTITCDPSDAGNCKCDGTPIGPSTWTPPKWLHTTKTSVFDTSAAMNGVSTPIAKFRAKAAIVVNVASA
jgi:hypothetical protein